jgi:hypothetical protein
VAVSVAEIVDGRPVPYPTPEWNNRKNTESFNAVQSVLIDADGIAFSPAAIA